MQVVENLRRTTFAPSVQMTDVPRDPLVDGMDDEADAILDDLDEDENKDKRYTKRRFDNYVEKDGELSESEDEESAAANGVRRQPNRERRRGNINYRHLDGDSTIDSGIVTPRDESSMPEEEPEQADKMDEAENAEPPAKPSPPAVEPLTKPDSLMEDDDTPVAETNGAAQEVEEKEPTVSTPASNLEVPHDNVDGDTTMEDADVNMDETIELELPAEEQEEESAAKAPARETTPPKPTAAEETKSNASGVENAATEPTQVTFTTEVKETKPDTDASKEAPKEKE